LTSRMHQIEYKAARLEAMKLQMANESTRVYEDYLEALDKTKIQVKTLTNDGAVTYVDVTSYDQFVSAGFALVYNNTVYTESDGLSKVVNSIAAIIGSGAASGVSIDSVPTALTNVINSGYVTIVAAEKGEGGRNVFYTPTSDKLKFEQYETSVATNTGLQEVSDEIELKKAEATYEASMLRIDKKERKYDSDLAAMENERSAIKQEMDTLKTVASDNVDRTFKLFS